MPRRSFAVVERGAWPSWTSDVRKSMSRRSPRASRELRGGARRKDPEEPGSGREPVQIFAPAIADSADGGLLGSPRLFNGCSEGLAGMQCGAWPLRRSGYSTKTSAHGSWLMAAKTWDIASSSPNRSSSRQTAMATLHRRHCRHLMVISSTKSTRGSVDLSKCCFPHGFVSTTPAGTLRLQRHRQGFLLA